MTVLQSIFLGLLQGFTEFLPVSSSGHLMLAEKLFDIRAGLFFDVMLHLGTLAAVAIAPQIAVFGNCKYSHVCVGIACKTVCKRKPNANAAARRLCFDDCADCAVAILV